ncbi:hypothetical protein DFH28DRAFT_1109122 [Melampsora americana]|nr:hypothetical protein DFH28DRAFT_1109122 [Melampsora americana]
MSLRHSLLKSLLLLMMMKLPKIQMKKVMAFLPFQSKRKITNAAGVDNQATGLIHVKNLSRKLANNSNPAGKNSETADTDKSVLNNINEYFKDDVSNLWFNTNHGKILCPMCNEEMPSNPSKKLVSLQADLLAMPNITKGIGHAGAMLLPHCFVSYTM